MKHRGIAVQSRRRCEIGPVDAVAPVAPGRLMLVLLMVSALLLSPLAATAEAKKAHHRSRTSSAVLTKECKSKKMGRRAPCANAAQLFKVAQLVKTAKPTKPTKPTKAAPAPVEPTPADPVSDVPAPADDALVRRVRSELGVFTSWLASAGANGYVGEVGWPNDVDTEAYNELARAWYRDAAAAGLLVSAWATGEWWGDTYNLSTYVWGPDRTLAVPRAQAAVIEAQPDGSLRGVNLNGGEFGGAPTSQLTSHWSNAAPGTYGSDWHYDSQASMDYLASRGITFIRLPFRWERVQPTPGAALDPVELGRITAAMTRAHNAGLTVVPTVMNYGAYYLHDGTQGVRRPVGSAQITHDHYADLWRRLSQAWAGHPAVAGYGLMNEPVGLAPTATRTEAQVWEHAAQRAVDAVRATGDRTRVFAPLYRYSNAHRAWEQHPAGPWIADPAGNTWYEAHHYWSSTYDDGYATYAQELTRAAGSGF